MLAIVCRLIEDEEMSHIIHSHIYISTLASMNPYIDLIYICISFIHDCLLFFSIFFIYILQLKSGQVEFPIDGLDISYVYFTPISSM